jgi:nucleotide-binding universal stress UspA family protein
MYKRILVPIDGSETSNRALRTAVALAAERSASLHVVHVCEETPIYVSMDTLPYPPAGLTPVGRRTRFWQASLLCRLPRRPRAENSWSRS